MFSKQFDEIVSSFDFRAKQSPAKSFQEDVHRENGWHKKPLEEYCGALRQLVNFFLLCTTNLYTVCVCVCVVNHF